MGRLEEGKVTPARYIKKIVGEAIGIGAARRRYIKDRAIFDPMMSMTNAVLGAGIGQIALPIFSAQLLSDPYRGRMLNEVPNLENVKFFGIALTALVLDLGIDALAVIMAIKGETNVAVAIKSGHNIATPVIADKIRPYLSTIVFQKSK